MKKLLMFLVIISITFSVSAQSPDKMSYQCIVRNSSGALAINQNVGFRISILQGSTTGTVVYQEIYNPNPQTNANGLVSMEIGNGTALIGTFASIDWSSGAYFLKTETDPTGGTNYTISGTTQLLSVPYAMYAKTAGNGFSGSYNDLINRPILFSGNYNDLINRPLLFDGTWANLNDKPTTIDGFGINDAVTTSGDQTVAGSKTFTSTINSSLHNIINLENPVNIQDAATKAYVDALFDKIQQLQADLGTKDVEGNAYRTVKIGNQVWMAENLKTTKYNDDTEIPLVTDNTEWSKLVTPGYCWYNNDESTYKTTYGALYNWYAVNTGKLCPKGWHVPTDAEWTILFDYLGGSQVAGGKLKEIGIVHWKASNIGVTNESGFTALPGGYRNYDGNFSSNIGYFGSWWTSTKDITHIENAYLYSISSSSIEVSTDGTVPMGFANSVRCLNGTTPSVLTTDVTTITSNSAYVGGNVTSDGNATVTERGIYWGTSQNPETTGAKMQINGTTGTFSIRLSGLNPNTIYYVMAYVSNSVGKTIGNEVSFTTAPTEILAFTTTVPSFVSATTTKSGGTVKCEGGEITSRGVCWSTSVNPTIANNITKDGVGTGTFTSLILGLIEGTTYYVRAYATNILGTFYGNQLNFTTQNYGTVPDIDGNVYKTLIIGTQTWMIENLKTTKYNDGSSIPLVENLVTWSSLADPGYCWYNNDITYKYPYGALYNWYTVNTGKLCPQGWHIPSDDEWTTLTTYLGGESVAGGKLKETGTTYWNEPNIGATNESGFKALPGGARSDVFNTPGSPNSQFIFVGDYGLWWSYTEDPLHSFAPLYLQMRNFDISVVKGVINMRDGMSIRCIKDKD